MEYKRKLPEILGFFEIKLQIEARIPILLKRFTIQRVPMIPQHHLLIARESIALKDAIFTMINPMV